MEVENLDLAHELFKANDKSKLDGHYFKKVELKNIFDTMVAKVNNMFRPLVQQYEEKQEDYLNQKNILEAENKDIVGKALNFRNKVIQQKHRIALEEKNKENLIERVEEERAKTRDIYKLPLWIFIVFGFVAGLGELLSYFHMFQSQEYIINELTGTSINFKDEVTTTKDGYMYLLLPLILGSSLVISIVFLSKFVGKVFKQLTDNDEYKKLNVLNENDQKDYDILEERSKTAEGETLKILQKEKKALKRKPLYAKFRYIAFHKEIWLFAIIGTAFVFTIAWGATKLRESALKQQYNAAKLSVEINQRVDQVIASEHETGDEEDEGFGDDGGAFGDEETTLGDATFGESDEGVGEEAPTVDKEAERAAKFKEIETIYNSRAEGSIWFFFINAMMYMVGILLGYFSYTSNRQFEGVQHQLSKKTKEIEKLHKELKKIEKESSAFNKSRAVTKFKDQYFKILKGLDENTHKLQYDLYQHIDRLKLNFHEFVRLQILNDKDTDLTEEYAQELFENEYKKLTDENKYGVFKYINQPISNFSHENTWEELLQEYNLLTTKGDVV